jgi:hypothetical protein
MTKGLTSWSIILQYSLRWSKKKKTAFRGAWNFTAVFTRPRHWYLYSGIWIQPTFSYRSFKVHFNIILPSASLEPFLPLRISDYNLTSVYLSQSLLHSCPLLSFLVTWFSPFFCHLFWDPNNPLSTAFGDTPNSHFSLKAWSQISHPHKTVPFNFTFIDWGLWRIHTCRTIEANIS